MSLASTIVEGVTLIIVCLLAFFGNLSLWFVIFNTRSLRDTSYYIVLMLSVADILVSSVSMPMTIYTIFRGYWAFPDEACKAIGFISMSTFIASVMSLATISLNRYVKICQSQHYKRIYSLRNVIFMTFGVWCFSFLLATPPLIGWGRYKFLPNQSFCFCDWQFSVSYTIFMITVCFGGPCFAMTFSYYKILKTFRSSSSRLFGGSKPIFAKPRCLSRKVSPSSSTPSIIYGESSQTKPNEQMQDLEKDQETKQNSVNPTQLRVTFSSRLDESQTTGNVTSSNMQIDRRKARRRQEEFVLSASLLLVIFVFVVCWLPFCIAMFITVFSPSDVPRPADMFTLMLGYINSCCNPLIYGFLNKRFKEGYRMFFKRFFPLCFKHTIVRNSSEWFDETPDAINVSGRVK